ncbi:hypothetical protein EIM48_03700 [Pseudoxanthomonas sp. SGNA-20]|jgi:hypothetical protein|uniref:hypothetical protein n=1 Tax=unclassified Pseudoxanthomonas TaxID=2645906 RepID=UPI00036C874B|nr:MULTISPECIES: hypothetical protein [unclassified Pseudoxanthomonas]RRN59151.1 hypothetical protein EIM48_03700 [Pseudoxanthomonas sp. SGNA-20]RRN78833.1 hypothetical protein EIM50_11410 [Pseudoxanthomonas sp. SGD-10]
MRMTPAQSALLNAREKQLLQARGPYEVKQLATLIRRTRELRDRQRDLAQRQRVAATTQGRSRESATITRTLRKEQLFSRALEHFEAQLARINRESSDVMGELALGNNAAASRPGRRATTAAAPREPSAGSAKKAGVARSRTGVALRGRAQAAFR